MIGNKDIREVRTTEEAAREYKNTREQAGVAEERHQEEGEEGYGDAAG